MRLRWMSVGAFAVLAALGACASNKDTNDSTNPIVGTGGAGGMDTDGSTVGCSTYPGLDTYIANLEKMGQRNVLKFTLVESQPAPPAKTDNVLTVRITAGDGMPIGGDLRTKFDMPQHGHSSPKTPTITFDDATGNFTVNPAYFFMPGVWRLEFDSYTDIDAQTPVDSGVFLFCVGG